MGGHGKNTHQIGATVSPDVFKAIEEKREKAGIKSTARYASLILARWKKNGCQPVTDLEIESERKDKEIAELRQHAIADQQKQKGRPVKAY